MMLSKLGAEKSSKEDLGNERLLRDIDAINKAIHPDRNRPRTSVSTVSSRSKSVGKVDIPDPRSKTRRAKDEPSTKDKKSFWNWKPLKAFSHIRNRRFNCCFSLHVHSIEGFPPAFNDVNIRVNWKRRDGEMVSRPVKVSRGIAEFEEQLTHICSVYGSRSGPHHSAKYEAKHFLLYVSVVASPEVDLGKHRVDLTRLLPLTLEELEEEKSSAKWTTSYKLSGKAKGAVMNVSFGYTVVSDNPVGPALAMSSPELQKLKQNTMSMSKSAPKLNQADGRSLIQRAGSLPVNTRQKSDGISQSVEDVKILHEVLPTSQVELSDSVNCLYKKLDEDNTDSPIMCKSEPGPLIESTRKYSEPLLDSSKGAIPKDIEDDEFSVIEQGVELSPKEPVKSDRSSLEAAQTVTIEPQGGLHADDQVKSTEGIVQEDVAGSVTETPDLAEHDGDVMDLKEAVALPLHNEEVSSIRGKFEAPECSSKDEICTKESVMDELESALNYVSNLELEGLDSPEDQDDYLDTKADFNMNRRKSHSLDDVTASVASEFFNIMGIEHSPFAMSSESEPDSPRERLLRQFEKDALASGCSLFDFGVNDMDQIELGQDSLANDPCENLFENFELPSVDEAAANEYHTPTHTAVNKTKAKMLENLETEALMREWGLNEKAFQGSPPNSSDGFGSPVYIYPEEPPQLPPLADGLGPLIQTDDGGILRSMSPALFKTAKMGGSLIMQASRPVVVPAQMGSGVMEILQHLASIGIEKLSAQANKLMPLEDITGPKMQQIAWEAAPTGEESSKRQGMLLSESQHTQEISDQLKSIKQKPLDRSRNHPSSSKRKETDSEYVSLEELAPLAMDKIEALSIEGLRIQSGMSNEEVPPNINSQLIGGSLGLEGAAGLQLLDIKGSDENGDELMGLSLTLDEWMRLDSGDIEDEDHIDEHTSKILEAHHANPLAMVRGNSKGEKRRGKGSRRKCGLLGNNFTVALMVQLRDPLRNYEQVGAPMLTLIQVERVFVPPKPRIYCTVPELRNNYREEKHSEPARKEERDDENTCKEEGIAQFKITEVHIAGLETEPGKRSFWGNSNQQQQSGSRWLLANGMGKGNKLPLAKPRAIANSISTPATAVVKSNPATAAPVAGKGQLGDSLWSISSRISGLGSKWKELSSSRSSHTRNPNVVFPKGSCKMR